MADSQKKFYRSTLGSLRVQVAEGDVSPEFVGFVPYMERLNGDSVKVGYLATDNAVAQNALKNDPNVTEIEKSEFEKSTDPKTAQRARR